MKKIFKIAFVALIAAMLMSVVASTASAMVSGKLYSIQAYTETLLRPGAYFPSFKCEDSMYAKAEWYKSNTYSENIDSYEKCTGNIVEDGYNYALELTVLPQKYHWFDSSTPVKVMELSTPNGFYTPHSYTTYNPNVKGQNWGYKLLFFIEKEDIGCRAVRTWEAFRSAIEGDEYNNIRLDKDIRGENELGKDTFKNIVVNGTKSLDLHGYKLEFVDKSNVDESTDFTLPSSKRMFYIPEGSDLTIDDTVGSGELRFNGYMLDVHLWAVLFWDTNHYYNYAARNLFEVDGGKLTVNGGSLHAGSAKEQYLQDKMANAYQIVTGTPIVAIKGDVIINGGSINGYSVDPNGSGAGNVIYAQESANVTVNGGTLRLCGDGHLITGTPVINGGVFCNESYFNIRTTQVIHVSNNFKKGGLCMFALKDESWKNGKTDVYINDAKVAYRDKLSLYAFSLVDTEVKFEKIKASGSVFFTSDTVIGKAISANLNGLIADEYKDNPSAVRFTWQSAAAGTNRWIDDQEQMGLLYTPDSTMDGRKLRLMVTVDGYDGRVYSPTVIVTKQSQDYGAPPVKPSLTVDYSSGKIKIENYSADQQYALTQSAAVPDWDTARQPSSGAVYTGLTKGQKYYVHTRYKETDEKKAGSKVLYTAVEIKETVYVTGIELEAEKLYARSGEYVKITVKPIPENATNFSGILGKNWSINSGTGSTAKLYATLRGMALNDDTYYTTVYLYGQASETTRVSAEHTIGYNNVLMDNVTVERADGYGRYSFGSSEISFRSETGASNITVARGTSAIVSLVNSSNFGDKPIDTIGWSKYSGDTVSGISITRIDDTNKVIVKIDGNSTIGTAYYNCVVNGTTMSNKLCVTVVDADIPAEEIILNESAILIKKGESKELVAKVLPLNSTDKVVWSTSDTGVATVVNGKVTAKSAGEAYITAKAGECETICKVTVSDKADEYAVDVTFGTSSLSFASKGQQVTVTADKAPENCAFDKWIASGVTLSKPTNSKLTFTMPGNSVSLTATYKVVSLGKPSTVTATQSTNSVTLTWSPVPGAEDYKIYQMVNGNWSSLGTTKNLTKTVEKLSAGTKYTFAVRAGWKKDGSFKWADSYSTINTATKALKPSKITATQSTSSIKLTWNKVPGATGYRIYYKSGNSWKVSVSATAATTHTFKNLKAGAEFTFAIRPYIKTDSGVVWSSYSEFTTATKPASVTVKASSKSSGNITLNWNQVAGADGYQIFYKTGNGSYKLYKTVKASSKSFTFSNLKSGAKFTFAVRAGIKTSGGNIYGGYTSATVTVK